MRVLFSLLLSLTVFTFAVWANEDVPKQKFDYQVLMILDIVGYV